MLLYIQEHPTVSDYCSVLSRGTLFYNRPCPVRFLSPRYVPDQCLLDEL